jgi:hypothetical protein
MILYHGTSTANSNIISTKGLSPRVDTKENMWKSINKIPSNKNFVYLTNSKLHFEFFAMRAALIKNSDCSIISVDTPVDALYPDENYIAQTVLGRGVLLTTKDMTEAQLLMETYKNNWEESLKQKGLVCHKNSILPNNIVNIINYSIEENLYFCFVKNFEKTIEKFDEIFNHWMLGIANGSLYRYAVSHDIQNDIELLSRVNINYDCGEIKVTIK